MSFHLEKRTLYTLLVDYMAQQGQLVEQAAQQRAALEDIEALIDFALYQADIAIDADAANRISRVGLAWLDYAQAHPDNPQGYAEKAKTTLESTATPTRK
ncbi:hypothetical protein [Oceanisphaera pacifica]|uniref:Uncharacterized protein n=1 Tax=Oceanisphaera pacifica TaxID=2818389 RepID=A0ABS3NBU0_9GAMM|nr:hypothetical protein [Oceanisphaera pacifica]MBO1518062.1 hypothetical protein [Oceanisphaera pacifica]